jgi:hypothetical protein
MISEQPRLDDRWSWSKGKPRPVLKSSGGSIARVRL